MLMSTKMSHCSGKLFTPALKHSTRDFCPLKDCFEEQYLNKDVRCVLQVTHYKCIFPKSLTYSPDEINLFLSWMDFQR